VIKYFVSYTFTTASSGGHGRTVVKAEHPITDIDRIEDLEEAILKHHNESAFKAYDPPFETVMVLNWRRFEEPSVQEAPPVVTD